MISNDSTISHVLKTVKSGSVKVALLCMLLSGSFSAYASSFELDPAAVYTEEFVENSKYLAMPLRFEPVAEVRKKLEKEKSLILKNRGEAHITVITPPEYEILKKHLSIKQINKIALNKGLLKSDLKFVCVGKAQVSEKLSTFFIVVKSQNLFQIRSEIQKAWQKKGGKGKFNFLNFEPHITLGFTERDLHDTDGAIKDERSCLPDMPAL